MTLEEFVIKIAGEFDETPIEEFTPDTEFKALDEWSSLSGLSIISMVDEELDKQVTGADLRSVVTIGDLYDLIQQK